MPPHMADSRKSFAPSVFFLRAPDFLCGCCKYFKLKNPELFRKALVLSYNGTVDMLSLKQRRFIKKKKMLKTSVPQCPADTFLPEKMLRQQKVD